MSGLTLGCDSSPLAAREEKVERRDIGAPESDGTARPKCADGARDMCDRELLATMERDFESICPKGHGRCSRRRGRRRAGSCRHRTARRRCHRATESVMVGAAGFEPASPCGQKILSLLCIPVPPRPRRPTGSEILDLLVHLANALLPLFLFGERLHLALALRFFLLLHALVRAADPLVDVLDPGR